MFVHFFPKIGEMIQFDEYFSSWVETTKKRMEEGAKTMRPWNSFPFMDGIVRNSIRLICDVTALAKVKNAGC